MYKSDYSTGMSHPVGLNELEIGSADRSHVIDPKIRFKSQPLDESSDESSRTVL